MGRRGNYFAGGEGMTILWCGGEDIDFIPVGTVSLNYYDSTYTRCNVLSGYSPVFTSTPPDGLGAHIYVVRFLATENNVFLLGLVDINGKQISAFTSNGSGLRSSIRLYNGSSWVTLADSSVDDLPSNGSMFLDLYIESVGAAAKIILYKNGASTLEYSGDLSSYGISNINKVGIGGNTYMLFSGVIVADEDTRLMRLKTLAPSAAGDTNDWTGAYTDVDEATLSDSDKIYSATDDADFQCNLTGMPTGTWSVKAVKVAARCVDGSGSTGIQLGVKSGGTVASGDTQTASGYWQTKERLMQVNPVTGIAFTTAEIEALQINLRAKAL